MLKSRGFIGQVDNENICNFLNEVYRINKDQQNWLTPRWQYAVHFINSLYKIRGNDSIEPSIRIWETETSEIVGIVNKEDSENTFIQIHPEYLFIEDQMIQWIEKNPHIYSYEEDGVKKVKIWVNDKRTSLIEALIKQGYKKLDFYESLRWQKLDDEIPEIQLPDGYSVSSFEEGIDIESKVKAAMKAFKSSFFPVELYEEMQRAPLYRKDLDIVAIYKEDIAAFCTVWFDEKNKLGALEPVGTHPDHQRKGICRALIFEALKRLKDLGAETAYVGSYGKEVGGFYESAGFINYELSYPWEKEV